LLSGTEAPPQERLPIIDEALTFPGPRYHLLAVQALGEALQISFFSRSGGAEYQGSGPPLEDWRPKIWQEIFDYWGEALKRLTTLALGKDEIGEQARNAIAGSIRGLVAYGRMEDLERAITRIVEQHGPYWPQALEQIRQAIRHDRSKISQEAWERLHKWEQLLQPRSISERLRLLVSIPPWADTEQGKDGHYIDHAEERAKALAEECAREPQPWLEHLPVLFQGEQRKAFAFGQRLGQCLQEPASFIDAALAVLAKLDTGKANPLVLAAFLGGLKARNSQLVQQTLERVAEDPTLRPYIVELTRLTKPALSDLERVLQVVQTGGVPVSAVGAFSYGSVLAHLPPNDLISFTDQLLSYGSVGAWIALDTLFLYQYGESDRWDVCKFQLRKLLMSSELNFVDQIKEGDLYHWQEVASRLLQETDTELAQDLTGKILGACTGEHSSLALNHAFQPVLECLLRDCRETIWPLLSSMLLSNDARIVFRLTNMLGSRFKNEEEPGVLFTTLSDDFLVEWCEAHPLKAPSVLASIMPLFSQEKNGWVWRPLAQAIIDRYGGQQAVLSAITSNLGTYSWSGSAVPYYERQVQPLEQLRHHRIAAVRQWAGEQLRYVERQLMRESTQEEERSRGIF